MCPAQHETAALDRTSPLPLFVQIRQRLLSDIQAWQAKDRRFPTDAALAERFGVSKMTVRQAIDELVTAGLLTRRRGAGTFITEAAFVERLTPSLDIDQQHRAAGDGQTVTVLGVDERDPTAGEAGLLDLTPGARVVAIRRLRSLGGGPAALDERVLEAGLAVRAGFDARTARGSIIARLKAAAPAVRARWTMTAMRAGRDLATLLVIDPDDPVLERAMRYLDAEGRVLMAGRTVHRSDRLACEVELDLD